MTVETLVASPLSEFDEVVSRSGPDRRRRAIVALTAVVAVLAVLVVYSLLIGSAGSATDLDQQSSPPSWAHPFGTDWLGRDMLARTARGLRLSLTIGVLAASCSAVIALLVAVLATSGRLGDTIAGWLIDLFLAVPHLVLLVLLAFVAGGGPTGVAVAVAVTHWPALSRVLRGETKGVLSSDYVAVARQLGRSPLQIARSHVLVHLLPQFGVGLALTIPHAVLHEAALSFLGLGFDPSTPAIGIILADSMRYLSAGAWWLAVFPGVALVVVVKLIDTAGSHLRALADPRGRYG